MKKECKKVSPLLGAYLDRQLSYEKLRSVESHLHRCQDCKEEIEALEEFISFTKRYTLPTVKPEEWQDCWKEIQNNIEKQGLPIPRQKLLDIFSPLLYLAFAATIAAFFLFLAPALLKKQNLSNPKAVPQIAQDHPPHSSETKEVIKKEENGKEQESGIAVAIQEKNEVQPEYIEAGENYSCFVHIPSSQEDIFAITIEEDE